MTSQYNVEPQPTAKVILNTTAGDLTLELFAKQTPLASRNFLQHCLDGYYNNTIFHRLVPGFIIQGGDPTGTGSGGISAINNGDAFEDEFHSRLKFNRRGLLGMANEGKDSNGSQFFLTLAATPELQGKNTMFGRIEGDTIFNLVKMADAELAEDSERPLYPTRVTGAEIILNPFTDMVARVRDATRTNSSSKEKSSVKKRKKPAGKSGLSFGLDEDEEQGSAPIIKKLKVNPKMVAAQQDEQEDPTPKQDTGVAATKTAKSTKPSRRLPSPAPVKAVQTKTKPPTRQAARAQEQDDESEDEVEEDQKTASRQAVLEQTNAEIAALKASMRRSNITETKAQEKPKSLLESMIPATSTRARKRGKAQDDSRALDMFNAFKQRLNDLPAESVATNGDSNEATVPKVEQPAETTNGEPDDEAELCDLHFIANCQSCKSWDEHKPDEEAEADGDDDPGWMSHQLTFAKDLLGKDLEWKKKMEEIEVIDPREKARLIKQQNHKKSAVK